MSITITNVFLPVAVTVTSTFSPVVVCNDSSVNVPQVDIAVYQQYNGTDVLPFEYLDCSMIYDDKGNLVADSRVNNNGVIEYLIGGTWYENSNDRKWCEN